MRSSQRACRFCSLFGTGMCKICGNNRLLRLLQRKPPEDCLSVNKGLVEPRSRIRLKGNRGTKAQFGDINASAFFGFMQAHGLWGLSEPKPWLMRFYLVYCKVDFKQKPPLPWTDYSDLTKACGLPSISPYEISLLVSLWLTSALHFFFTQIHRATPRAMESPGQCHW